jgi:hypothetical protein
MACLVNEAPFENLALDATDLGLDLYRELGFEPLETIVRLHLERDDDAPNVPPGSPGARVALSDPMAARLARRNDVAALQSGSAVGLVRPGRTALHVGPVVSGSEADAAGLVVRALRDSTGPAIIDVPTRAGTFARRLKKLGFHETRSFRRMSRGRAFFVSPGTFAIAGPEFG